MSEDQSALRQMMRLRGFSLMTNIMDDYEKDLEIGMLVRPLRNRPEIQIHE
jgi:hypothetical protein